MARVGVVLLNLGGPERIQDVGPFLFNLFADPERSSAYPYRLCRSLWPG